MSLEIQLSHKLCTGAKRCTCTALWPVTVHTVNQDLAVSVHMGIYAGLTRSMQAVGVRGFLQRISFTCPIGGKWDLDQIDDVQALSPAYCRNAEGPMLYKHLRFQYLSSPSI